MTDIDTIETETVEAPERQRDQFGRTPTQALRHDIRAAADTIQRAMSGQPGLSAEERQGRFDTVREAAQGIIALVNEAQGFTEPGEA